MNNETQMTDRMLLDQPSQWERDSFSSTASLENNSTTAIIGHEKKMMALVHRSFCFHPFLCPSIHVLSLLCPALRVTRDAEQACTQHKLPVYRRATTSLHSHIYGQLRVANSPHTLNFGLWEEASEPAENPHRQGWNTKTWLHLFFSLCFIIYISYCIFHCCISCFFIHLCGPVFD